MVVRNAHAQFAVRLMLQTEDRRCRAVELQVVGVQTEPGLHEKHGTKEGAPVDFRRVRRGEHQVFSFKRALEVIGVVAGNSTD